VPYRIDLDNPCERAFNRLVELGALDIEPVDGGIAAIMPDGVDAAALPRDIAAHLKLTPARGRDDGSIWVVRPRAVRIGHLQIVPADWPDRANALRLVDSDAFGTGLHPTTALCLEALEEEVLAARPTTVLDVGTGSGILALAALHAGVPAAVAIDIDAEAVRVAARNARLNGLTSRLGLVQGGPAALSNAWPLVLANVLAAPLIDLAPTLARRVDRRGRLILSGIRTSLARDVERAYRRAGMQQVGAQSRDGWTALILHASWSAIIGKSQIRESGVVFHQAGAAGQRSIGELERHEHVIRHVILAVNVPTRRGGKSEARIEAGVSEHDHGAEAKRTAAPQALPDQRGTHAPPLTPRQHGDRSQPHDPENGLRRHRRRREHDVSDDVAALLGHQRHDGVRLLAQRVNEIRFRTRVERRQVDRTNPLPIARALVPDHRGGHAFAHSRRPANKPINVDRPPVPEAAVSTERIVWRCGYFLRR
jgi:ribosomal protein L11 methyltransferase